MPPRIQANVLRCLLAMVLIYAFLAGLRTVARADLGWQLATGRWISQNHIPSTDVLSHTARGREWIYPPVSSLILYDVHRVGGFAGLSWFGALVCVGTFMILLRHPSAASLVLAILAVPVIAERTGPRAEMFTVTLFAAFVLLLWRLHNRDASKLWLLPLLMFFWVNLHLGFIAGLALIVAYVAIEFGDMTAAGESFDEVKQRLRPALPWLAGTFVATFANLWSWRIYRAIAEQERAMAQHAVWFGEWTPIRLTGASLRQALWVRDPKSAIFWLLFAALLAALFYMAQRRFGSALVLVVAGWLTIQHNRYDALFSCVVIVIAAPAYTEAIRRFGKRDDDSPERATSAPALILLAVVLIFVGLRSFDLVTNRAYLRTLGGSVFGAGLSSTYPRAAADFIVEHHLPRELLNDYSNGGYWLWALGPEYPDYVDGRALPFGAAIIQRSEDLLGRIPPDSPEWDEEVQSRSVQTVAVGLGTSNFSMLPAFCRSQNWTPVFLDAWGAVFVHRQPDNSALDSLRIDCATAPLVAVADTSPRSRAEHFYALVSGARILQLLERNQEALDRLNEAQTIFAGNADVTMQRGIALYGLRRTDEAERALRQSVEMRPSAQNCAILGQFYAMQKRPHSAITAYRCAAALAPYPARTYISIAQMQLQANDPKAALTELDRAWRHADEAGPEQMNRFRADVAEFRARAYWAMQDSTAAVNALRQATELDAGNPSRWQHLADLYDAMNRPNEAAQARQHAQQISH